VSVRASGFTVGRRLIGLAVALTLCALLALGSAPLARADGVPFHSGDVLAALGNGNIGHFSPSGTLLDTLATTSGSSEGTGMCFDAAGNLYTTNFESNSMSEFDKNGNLVAASFGSGFNQHPESCSFSSANQMFVGQADGLTKVLEFNTSGNLLNSFSPAPQNRGTDWVDLTADQHTLRYTSEGSSIKQFDVATNTQLPDFATGLPAPCFAHRALPDGGDLVACRTEVVELNPSGTQIHTYPVDPSDNLFALNLDPNGTSFWTADFNGTIWHVDIASGTVINTFSAHPTVDTAGLAIVGEPTAGRDQPITAAGASGFSATEGRSSSGTVATFTDPDTSAVATDYSASINWGDGSTSTGTISGGGGSFTVTGSHTYAEEGSHTITATVTDLTSTSNTATATSTATVSDAALSPSGTTIHPVEGSSSAQTVASFTDADPAGSVSDYAATINWGDGTTTNGTITANGSRFKVTGRHAYAEKSSQLIKVTIRDKGGAVTNTNSTAKVADARLHAKRGHPVKKGMMVSGTIVNFTDADPHGTLSDYRASIHWGDGTTSAGTISKAHGKFRLRDSHTYKKGGTFKVVVTIKEPGGSTARVRFKVTLKATPVVKPNDDHGGQADYDDGVPHRPESRY